MASLAAYDALRNLLEAQFLAAPLFFENEEHEPPASGGGARWVYVEIESDEDDQQEIGAGAPAENAWRETGILTAYAIVPAGEGVREGNHLRDQLADIFRGLTVGGVTCLGMTRAPGAKWDETTGGNWFGLPLVVNWQRDH